MSDMNGNPHYDAANAGMYTPCTSESEATLALAYEQRTANLLAYWTDMTADEDAWEDTPFQRDMDSISRDFRTRMGLTPEIGK